MSLIYDDRSCNRLIRRGDTKGPRQPWHDLHCRLDGPAAYGVLKNFEQRWRKATRLREMFGGKAAHRKDDALLKLERIPWILSPSKRRSAAAGGAADANADDDERDQPALHVVPDGDSERWHAQVFRTSGPWTPGQ